MKLSHFVGIAASVVLASTSAAHADCYFNFRQAAMDVIGNSTCLFMGSQEDYAAWGADSCNGMANVIVAPQYNDQIIDIIRTEPGRITVMKNVMRDENVLVVDSHYFPADGDWTDAVSVVHCH